jgi:hypothetical protein
MQETVELKKVGFVEAHRVELVALGSTALVTAASASTDINATITPILNQIVALIPTLVDLIIAIVPAILILAVVGFIVAFFEAILSKIKM